MNTRMKRFIFKPLGSLLAVLSLMTMGLTAQAEDMDKIIISGASGNLGGLVVEELINNYKIDPSNLILVSRSPDALEQYKKMGASVRFGDFTKPESLAAAYKGGDRMLLISIGFGAGARVPLHKNAIDAAVAAGVKHIAYTSYVNADVNIGSPLATDHRATEEILRASGVAWTMLRNNFYARMLLMDTAIQAVREGRLLTAQAGEAVAYVTREDCAAAAAAVLAKSGHEYKSYNISGPDLIGPKELAALASTFSGKEVKLMPMEPDALVALLIKEGVSEEMAKRRLGFDETKSPYMQQTSTAIFELTGRPATRVSDMFAAERDAFIKAAQ